MPVKLRSQPRLPDGEARVQGGSRLPEVVEDNLRAIARKEKKSLPWVKAEIICDWFGIDAVTGLVKGEHRTKKQISVQTARRRNDEATAILGKTLPFRKVRNG